MGRLPQTNTSVSRYLRQQKRVVTRLANSTPYALSGTSVVAPGLTKVDERIVAGTPGGSRVELDSAGLRKYGANGTDVEVDMTGPTALFSGLITGSEIVGGEFKTAATGNRVEIIPDAPGGGGRIKFYSGSVNETYPAEISGYAAGAKAYVMLHSPNTVTQGAAPYILLTTAPLSEIGLYADRAYINPSPSATSITHIGGESLRTNITTLEMGVDDRDANYQCLMRRIFVVANTTARAALVAQYTVAPRSRAIDATHPLFIWQADAAAGAQLQYTTDGTTWTVIGGGGSTTLFADPNADRLAFWDDSAGAFAALTPSTGLTLTGTDLTVRSASDTQTGISEFATPAETITGTDDTRATTPAGVKAAIYAPGAAGTGVAYSAGWADYGAGNALVTWYKDKDGYIRMSGTLKRTGATVVAGLSGVIFTLPIGARPAGTTPFLVNKDEAAIGLLVYADGTVQIYSPASAWTGGSSYAHLGAVMFRAA